MIIGGAYQGKAAYAKAQFPDVDWKFGGEITEEELLKAAGVLGFQEYIRKALMMVSFPDEIDVFVFLYPINVACSLSLACFSVIESTKVPSSFVLVNFKGLPLRSSVMETLARRLWVNESST